MSDSFVRISCEIDSAYTLNGQWGCINRGMTPLTLGDMEDFFAFAELSQSQRLDIILSGIRSRKPEATQKAEGE